MKSHGKLLGIPYDIRFPGLKKIINRIWNKSSNKILVPKVFGWGYTINWHALLKKLKLVR